MKTRIAIIAGITGAFTIAAAPVSAQERISDECRTEARALCSMEDRRERRACMQEKFSQLSETCQSEVTKMREARANGEGGQRQRGNRQGQGQGQGSAGAMSESGTD